MKEIVKKNITIKDIAKLAGVSAGTVDRVINKRGNVSLESEKKVKEILSQVDFQPNVLARSLSQKKKYNIAILIPQYEKDEYWEKVNHGMELALSNYSKYNISAKQITFDQYNRDSFHKACKQVMNENINGVILAPMFTKEAQELTSQLEQVEIPYIFIDSDISTCKPLSFFGIDSTISGKIGAISMMKEINPSSNILILKPTEPINASNQSILREKGFCEVIHKSIPEEQIFSITVYQDIKRTYSQLDKLFEKETIHGVVTFNSKGYIFTDYIRSKKINPVWVLGFDTIPKNVAALKDGYISLLIGQNPNKQGLQSVTCMSRYLTENISPKRMNYEPIDLLIKENIDFYLMNE